MQLICRAETEVIMSNSGGISVAWEGSMRAIVPDVSHESKAGPRFSTKCLKALACAVLLTGVFDHSKNTSAQGPEDG